MLDFCMIGENLLSLCFIKAQFADCVLALGVIEEIVINSMTIGKIMKIRPPVSWSYIPY